MKRIMHLVVPVAALLVAGGCSKSAPGPVGPGGTDTPPSQAAKVTAESVMDRFVEVTGGAAAHRALKSSKSTGVMEMVGSPMKGTLQTASMDGKYAVTIDLAGVGKIQLGYDGTTAWSMDPMTGARVITGVERAQAVRQNDPQAAVKWREHFKTYELEGTEDLDGKKVHVVALVDVDGVPETRYFDVETGYLVKSATTVKSQGGDVPVETVMSDYTEHGGVKMASKVLMKQGPQSFLITINSVEVNPTIDPALFALPDDIKKLVEAKPAE